MDDRRPGRSRAIPRGFLGMVALVVGVESGVSAHRAEFSTLYASHFEFSSRAARAEAPGRDVLCFGDSVLKFGVVPRLIEERTGLRAYNLATVGNPAPVSYLLLRQALESGARPRALLVDFKPFLQQNDYRPDLPALARIAGLLDGLELARTARDAGLLGPFAADLALPTFRDRIPIRSAIRRALLDLPDPERPRAEARRRNWEVNLGAQLLPPNPLAPATAEFDNERPNLKVDWACHPANAAYIDKFLRLAADYRIPVYWVLTPIHPRLQAGRDRLGIDEAFTRFVRGRSGREGVVVVDGRRLGLDPDLFVDATHCDRRGAVAISEALAGLLREPDAFAFRRPARWVALPPRGRPPDDGRLEDTDQSAVALRDRAEIRRR